MVLFSLCPQHRYNHIAEFKLQSLDNVEIERVKEIARL